MRVTTNPAPHRFHPPPKLASLPTRNKNGRPKRCSTAGPCWLPPWPPPAIAQPARTATLRFVPQANLTLLDPVFSTTTVTNNHGYAVFDTLFSTDGAMRPQPQMASGAEVSPDGRTWRIRLRDGLRFHDGTPVLARDCIASIERWSRKDVFGLLLASVVDRYVVLDDRTFEIRLAKPFPLLLDALGKADSIVCFIMPERIAQAAGPDKQVTELIGSGPYRFLTDEYVSGSHVAYARFDGYVPRGGGPEWGTGGKIAHFPRVEWRIIPDAATAAAALQNNEVDWWEQPLNDLLPTLARNPGIATQIDNPLGRLAVARLNCLQPPFDDVRIRRAFLAAVNQDDYMQAAHGDDRTLWSACRSVFPCGTPYETADGGGYMKNDVAAARAMLREAGYAGQKAVVINPTDFGSIGPLGQVTAATLRNMGMETELRESDWGTVVQRRASKEPVEKGGWSVFHTFGSGTAWLTPATAQTVRGLGEAGWYGWWRSDHAEALTQAWLDAPTAEAQSSIAHELSTHVLQDVGTVPLGRFYIRTAYRRSITGILQGVAPYMWNVRPA